MALDPGQLQSKLLVWMENKQNYTSISEAADAFSIAYVDWAKDALAGGVAPMQSIPPISLLADPIKAIGPINIPPAYALAVATGMVAWWSAVVFESTLGGPTTILGGVPPNPVTISAPLLAAMLSTYILPSTTDPIVAASMSAIFYASIVPSVQAIVNTITPFLVPVT